MHTLYKLTFASGKSYIGQTTRTLKARLSQHKQRSINGNSLLPVHCAWRKYGEPVVEVIGEFGSDDELHSAEIAAIATHGVLAPNGYNVGYGGETAPSKNPEVAAKISEKIKGRKIGDTTNMSAASKLMWTDDEYRAKVSAGLKKSWTAEMKKAASDRIRSRWAKRKEEGWAMPESHREKLRTKIVSDETRKKMSDSSKGKPKAERSVETRKKLSDAVRNTWKDDDHSKRRSKAISVALSKRYANMTAEQKEELSKIRRKAWETRREPKNPLLIENR